MMNQKCNNSNSLSKDRKHIWEIDLDSFPPLKALNDIETFDLISDQEKHLKNPFTGKKGRTLQESNIGDSTDVM